MEKLLKVKRRKMEFKKKWKIGQNENYWTNHQYNMLYPYFFRFEITTGIKIIEVKKVTIKTSELSILKDLIDELLRSISLLYVSPSQQQITKNGGKFEKINFEGFEYKVNFSQSDRLGFIFYSIFYFSDSIKEAIEEKENLLLIDDSL